ncbi:MAG TPA: hypothetical protein PK014_08090 [Thermoanaerobaculia bacterium]|nr:hypothetical protein [Thermoanaerobaculia bacterium]HUM30211.1 hypothetical protein [Thermoanaerobaculia bacterium]HXK68340.1 hypothetical protein [Thermoanaerobaculia bacterium]
MKSLVIVFLSICILAAFLWFLDRCLLWMEARGWIYYRKKKTSPGTARNAFLHLQTMVDPGKQIIIEEQEKIWEDGAEIGNGDRSDHS